MIKNILSDRINKWQSFCGHNPEPQCTVWKVWTVYWKNIEYRPRWGIGNVNYYNNGITAIGTSVITYVHSTNTNTLAITNKWTLETEKKAPINSTGDYGSSGVKGSRGFDISYKGEIHLTRYLFIETPKVCSSNSTSLNASTIISINTVRFLRSLVSLLWTTTWIKCNVWVNCPFLIYVLLCFFPF